MLLLEFITFYPFIHKIGRFGRFLPYFLKVSHEGEYVKVYGKKGLLCPLRPFVSKNAIFDLIRKFKLLYFLKFLSPIPQYILFFLTDLRQYVAIGTKVPVVAFCVTVTHLCFLDHLLALYTMSLFLLPLQVNTIQ